MRKSAVNSATFGFLICVAFALVFYTFLYFNASAQADKHAADIMSTFGDSEALARTGVIADARWVAMEFLKLVLSLLTVYWLAAGVLGRGKILRPKSANVLLVLAIACLVAVTLNRYYFWAETYCDVLPYPHEGFHITKIYECPSSQIFYSSLHALAILLFFLSLLLRIVLSRKVYYKEK